jgi:RNA polymerase-binding protein DksA
MTEYAETDKKALQDLLQLESELTSRLKQLSADMSKSHSLDSSEQAVERENDEVIEQLEEDTSEELVKVKQAIQRVKQGNYHACTNCGGEISIQRLEAIPYSTLCIDCANTTTDM